MRTTWQPLSNETKPITFLLVLTFLFLFSSVVFGDDFQDFQDGVDAYKRKDHKEQSIGGNWHGEDSLTWWSYFSIAP